MGDRAAQYVLGEKYLEGEGVKCSHREAAIWFRKSALQGHPSAQYNLGYLYLQGKGLKQNNKEALIWLNKAAAQGNKEAKKQIKLIKVEMLFFGIMNILIFFLH